MTTTAEIRSIADDMQDDLLTIRDLLYALIQMVEETGSMTCEDDHASVCRLAYMARELASEANKKRETIWQGLAAAN